MRKIFVDHITGNVIGDSEVFAPNLMSIDFDLPNAAILLDLFNGGSGQGAYSMTMGPGLADLLPADLPGIRVYNALPETPQRDVGMPAAPPDPMAYDTDREYAQAVIDAEAAETARQAAIPTLPVLSADDLAALPLVAFLRRVQS